MSINSTTSTSSTSNLLQSLNTISTPGGIGLPVTTYAQEMQSALQLQLTTGPNNQISAMQAQTQAIDALQSDVQAFQTATYTLAASTSWSSVTGTSSNPSAFTFTTNTGAQPGSYSINISQLAQNEFYVGASGLSTTSATIATGSFVIQPTTLNSGTAVTISVDSSNDTLQGLEYAINNDTSSTGVLAGIIYNGSTYQLSLSSDQTGTNYAFSITGSATGQFGFPSSANVSATNAALTVDNIPITSQTNSFVNAVPNVVIQANATGTGNINLSQDTSTTISAVQNWMDAYNKIVDLVKSDTTYTAATSSTSGTNGPLFNDFVATNIPENLMNTVMQKVSNAANASLSSLSDVGIITDPQSGHLEFQPSIVMGGTTSSSLPSGQTIFQNAYNQNPQAVMDLFGVVQNNSITSAVPTNGMLGNVTTMLNSYLIGTGGQTGLFAGDLNAISQQQTQVQSYLTQINKQITTQVANFTLQMNNLNAAMARSQALSAQLTALIGGSNTALSSSSSSSSTSSGG